jgi:hypothetical protein
VSSLETAHCIFLNLANFYSETILEVLQLLASFVLLTSEHLEVKQHGVQRHESTLSVVQSSVSAADQSENRVHTLSTASSAEHLPTDLNGQMLILAALSNVAHEYNCDRFGVLMRPLGPAQRPPAPFLAPLQVD